MNNKGFTLIELLVVIAIIAILSAVAIVYLTDARVKAQDAAVDSNVSTASTQFEIDKVASTTITTAYYKGDADFIITKLGAHPCATAGRAAITYSQATADSSTIAFYGQRCGSTDWFCADTNGYRGTTSAAISAGIGRCK